MLKKRMKRFSALLLSMLLFLTSIPMGSFASEQKNTAAGAEKAGSFVFAAFTQNETVVEPVSISYEAKDTVKDALAKSEISIDGLEVGFIQSVEGIVGNYSMVYADGGFGLDVAADQVVTMFLSERTDVVRKDEDKEKDDPDDLVAAVSSALTIMAGYNESENNVQNYKPAQTAYSTLLNLMRTADKDTMKTKTADLKEQIAAYGSYLNSDKRTVTVHVTQGGNEVRDAKLTFTDEYGNVTEATGNQIQLRDGKYRFVITDSHKPYNYTTNVGKMNGTAGAWNIIENYFTVSESSTEVSVKLASGEWFGTITAAGSKNNVLDTSKTEYDTENHKIVFYVADSYSHRVDTITQKAAGTPTKTTEGTLSSVDIYPWIDFVYGSGNNAGKKVSDVAQTSNTNKASFGSNKINNNVLDLGMTGNTLTAEIRWLDDTEDDATGYMVVQSYELEVKRIPTLTELVVKDRAGTSVLTGYNTYVYNYDVTTTDSSFTVETAAYGENYTVTLKAGENTAVDGEQVTLNGEKGQFTVEVASGDATNTYTVNLTKVEAVDVTLNLPENVTADVLNANGSKIEPKEAGGSVYALVPGGSYTYDAVKEEQYHTTASFTAAADLTVQVAEPEVKAVLTNFAMYDAMSKNTRKPYVWDQPFTSSVHNYTVQVSDVNTAVFAQADKSDTKYDYYVRYVQQNTSTTYGDVLKDWTKQNINFSVGETTTNAQNIMRLVAASGKGNLFQLRVQKTVSGVTYYQEYDFNLVRTLHLKELSVSSASAGKLQLLDGEGKAVSFDRDVFTYNVKIAADTTSLSMTMTFPNENSTYSFDGGYSAEVNGKPAEDVKNVTIPLDVNKEEETVTIKVLHKDTKSISNTYTIKIKKQTPIAVTFNTNPKNATVFITNTLDNKNIYADENGIFTMMPGVPYNYIVTATGYKALEVSDYTLDETPAEVTVDINLEQAPAAETALPDYEAQWPTFRADFNGNGVVSAKTPTTSDDAVLYWAEKLGEGFDSDASGCPILVDGYLYTYAGDRILKVDTISGKVVKDGKMATKSSFAINSPTYADGMIFVGLSGGKVQAFNAETLESLWLYTDPLGGQPNCAIKYYKGHIYTGFWNSETKKANFVCISVTDEDPTQTTEAKKASWRYTHNGFYWAGAYACDDYVLVGTDDGESGYTTGHASVLSFNPTTGKLIDEKVLPGVGDLRSDIMYDKEGTGDFYFTTKGGDFYGLSVNANGTFKNLKQLKLYNYSNDSSNPAMSTCTPVVYNGRAYIGVSGVGQFSAYSGHNITVIDLESWSIAYTVRTQGYPQTSGLLTTAYEKTTGYVYVYFIDNYTPGKLRVIADQKGQTEPKEVMQENGYDVAPVLFTPYGAQAQYAICSPISDENGFMYFKNDSAHMMCVGPALEKIEVTKQPDKTTYQEGEPFDPKGMEVIATYSNGTTRDITDYVTYSTDKLTKADTELIIEFPYVMYQDKDGQTGVEYTAPTARVTLTITDAEPDTSAADEVTKKINAIGEVTLESEAAILEARAAYDALEEEQKNYVTEETLKVLTDAESRLTELKEAEAQKKADQEAAAAVTEQINAIGEVTLESEAVIQAARAAYEGLTEAQRAYVTEETLKALTDAENVLAQLKKEASDKELAKAVEAAIAEIGEVTLEKENLIVAIRANYDALTEEQKAYIEEETLKILTDAESRLAELKEAEAQKKADQEAAAAVTEQINAIGEVTLESESAIQAARTAYEGLTEAQRAYVTEETLKVLTDAESRLAELKEAEAQKKADQEAAAAVTEQINAIGEVTLESETAIQAARAAYEDLTEAQRAYVTKETLKVLTDAESRLTELKEAEAQKKADQEAAEAVTEQINAIGEVTLESETAVKEARAAYEKLTEKQKSYVTAETLKILTDAESKLAQLQEEKDHTNKPENGQNGSSGNGSNSSNTNNGNSGNGSNASTAENVAKTSDQNSFAAPIFILLESAMLFAAFRRKSRISD